MAQPQRNISVGAPGFLGINTEQGPIGLGLEWAAVANNCIIDDNGRMASRKGLLAQTADISALNGNPVEQIKEYRVPDGSRYIYSAGNNLLFHGVGTITSMPSPNAITDNNWQIVPFKGQCFFIQEGHQPLMTTAAAPTVLVDANTASIPNVPVGDFPTCGTAGEGHAWIGGYSTDRSLVAWSANILDASWATGDEWTGGDSGQLDLSLYWPTGFDVVTAMIIHNGFLYIFGEISILIFSGAEDPTNSLQLQDSVNGIGCIARDSVVPLGRDMFFLDANGVRSMSRVIQEKSAPIGDISSNIHTDLEVVIRLEQEKDRIRADYSPEEYLYVLTFPSQQISLAFDTRMPLENGARRVTSWPNANIYSMERTAQAETFFGGTQGITLYAENVDVASNGDILSIAFEYQTHPQDFDQPVNSKFPKQVDVTYIGGQGQCLRLLWGYDYNQPSLASSIENCFADISLSEYNIAEYGVAEYSSFNEFISDTKYNVWGSGRNIAYRFEMVITKSRIAIQQLDMQALSGRIL